MGRRLQVPSAYNNVSNNDEMPELFCTTINNPLKDNVMNVGRDSLSEGTHSIYHHNHQVIILNNA